MFSSIENHTGWSAKEFSGLTKLNAARFGAGTPIVGLIKFSFVSQGGASCEPRGRKKGLTSNYYARGGALWVHPMTWCSLTFLSAGTVVLTLASDEYEESEYIRERVSSQDWFKSDSVLAIVRVLESSCRILEFFVVNIF